MDENEELFREMNPEDPYYMGRRNERPHDYMGERNTRPHESRKWQQSTTREKKGKELLRSQSRREKIEEVLLATMIWVAVLFLVLILLIVMF